MSGTLIYLWIKLLRQYIKCQLGATFFSRLEIRIPSNEPKSLSFPIYLALFFCLKKKTNKAAPRPKQSSPSRGFKLRWPSTVTAISIWPRQFQFGHGKINLATAISIWPRQNQFGHGNFNLATVISIWPRQNQFGHGEINLAMAISIYTRDSQCAVGDYPTWRWVNGTTVENVLCKLWIYGIGSFRSMVRSFQIRSFHKIVSSSNICYIWNRRFSR